MTFFNLNVTFVNLNVTFLNLYMTFFNLNVNFFNLNATFFNLNVNFFNLNFTFFNFKVKRCSLLGLNVLPRATEYIRQNIQLSVIGCAGWVGCSVVYCVCNVKVACVSRCLCSRLIHLLKGTVPWIFSKFVENHFYSLI